MVVHPLFLILMFCALMVALCPSCEHLIYTIKSVEFHGSITSQVVSAGAERSRIGTRSCKSHWENKSHLLHTSVDRPTFIHLFLGSNAKASISIVCITNVQIFCPAECCFQHDRHTLWLIVATKSQVIEAR